MSPESHQDTYSAATDHVGTSISEVARTDVSGTSSELGADPTHHAQVKSSCGKGKGKGPSPPPPKAKGDGKGKSTASIVPKARPTSKLVCLHWKATYQPEDVSGYGDEYLAKLTNLGPFLEEDMEQELLEAKKYLDPPTIEVPKRPDTVFNPVDSAPPAPPRQLLEHYFEKNMARSCFSKAVEADGKDVKKTDLAQKQCILDDSKLQMLGVMMKKFVMEHKGETLGDAETARGLPPCDCQHCVAVRPQALHLSAVVPGIGQRELQAILAIKRGVLRCDFNVVRLEALSIIRTVLRQHDKVNEIRSLVQEHGEVAIARLCHADMHCLVYELSKIPQIDQRLECMIFSVTYEDSFSDCRKNLETLTKALQMLLRKRECIRRFFLTAHRLGQSFGLKADRGFQLSTLDKLAQTKSTKLPNLSILHFVLALMDQEHAEDLFDAGDIALLQAASSLKTDKVIQDARELTKGLYGVEQLFGVTGKYRCPVTGNEITIQKRRKSRVPVSAGHPEDLLDDDDKFHEVMKAFVNANLASAEDIAEWAWHDGLTYKELAVYFDDVQSVHPPPRSSKDPKEDLLDIFFRFAEAIKCHRGEVEQRKLRELVASCQTGTFEENCSSCAASGSLTRSGTVPAIRMSSVAGGDLLRATTTPELE